MPPPSVLQSGQEKITRDCNNYFSVVMQCHVQKQLGEEIYDVGGIESIMVGKARCRRKERGGGGEKEQDVRQGCNSIS